ncbi:aldolase/citrate lyase family protein [Candidatus Planktophila dulcis]|uniref:aldolase/citrate lyase family protein n=1 Tax=Candidatus Planktophila dulcis TaxID=1884914 RepID=UPI003CEAD5ED
MNKIEKKMVEILERGKISHGVVSVKAEFEAEGTRTDELLRLVDVSRSAGLPLTLKIGGCEAIRDLLEAKQIGVRFIVAPMIETPYALSKYIKAVEMVYSPEEREDTDFLFNMETITAYNHREELIQTAKGKLSGIVFGRVDFSGSMGLGRDGIETSAITDKVVEVAKLTKSNNLDLVMGGAISSDALENVKIVESEFLTRFETRKVVFKGSAVAAETIQDGLLNAVHFELLWLMNKRDYYASITKEDQSRIEMLEARWKVLGKEVF